ncbi:MAG: hypothetical protein R2683_04225 [Bifidobacterium adolescentis]
MWAPTAAKVELITTWNPPTRMPRSIRTIDMTSESKGVAWAATVKKLASGTAYSCRLTFADGTVNLRRSPYATAAVANVTLP